MNSDLSDIGSALTGSLARDGQGGMTAVLPLHLDGFTYTNDPNTGMYRTSADAQAIKCGGSDIAEFSASGMNVIGGLTVNGVSLIPVGLGPLPWSRVAAPTGWVFVGRLYSRATYPALWAVAQAEIALGSSFYTTGDGSTTFGVGLDMPGCVPACNDSISGSAAGTLTQAVFGSDPSVIGNAGGAQTHTLITAELASHSHGTTDPGHDHPWSVPGASTNMVANIAGGGTVDSGSINNYSVRNVSLSSAFTGLTVNAAGSGSAHNNVQPTIITNYIIFAGV